jgi:hypothetical protein
VISILGGNHFADRVTAKLSAHQEGLTRGENCNQDHSQESARPQSGCIEGSIG